MLYQLPISTANTSALSVILVSESPRKTQHSEALEGRMLWLHREEAEEVSFNTGCTPWQTSLLAANTGQFIYSHHFLGTVEGTLTPPWWSLKQNKAILTAPKQGKVFPLELIGLAQALWALYLLISKLSRPKAHFFAAGVGEVKRLNSWDHISQ